MRCYLLQVSHTTQSHVFLAGVGQTLHRVRGSPAKITINCCWFHLEKCVHCSIGFSAGECYTPRCPDSGTSHTCCCTHILWMSTLRSPCRNTYRREPADPGLLWASAAECRCGMCCPALILGMHATPPRSEGTARPHLECYMMSPSQC